MKYLITILFLLTVFSSYGQYTLDDTIKNHSFLKQIFNDECSIHYGTYYEPQDMYYYNRGLPCFMINGAKMDCYILQEQLKDTLRDQFNDDELFHIASFSKMTFYRIAAFELYTQTDYDKDSMIDFLRSETEDSIPEMYMPMPNALTPTTNTIRSKMLEIVDPTAKRKIRKDTLNGYIMVEAPKYPQSTPLDYEKFIELSSYVNNFCASGIGTWYNGSPSFILHVQNYNFGKIDHNYLDISTRELLLKGYIKVTNNTQEAITIKGKASSHTMCLNSKYTIEPKEEILIEFKSLVDLENIGSSIERSITLQNLKTGEAQLFKFNAQFINR